MADEYFEIEFSSASTANLPKDVVYYWIHCNRCFELYVHRRRRIFLMACDHTVCEECVAPPPRKTPHGSNQLICPLCKNMQRFQVLCSSMPAKFKELLNPQPWSEPNERTLNFQAKQRESFSKGMFNRLLELDKIRKRCKLLEMSTKEKYEKYEQARLERKRLEREVLRIKQQELQQKSMHFQATPRSRHNTKYSNVDTCFEPKRITPDVCTPFYSGSGGSGNTQRSRFNDSFAHF